MILEAQQAQHHDKLKSGKFDEIIHKSWPKAKEEMEKGIREARRLIVQGERHLSELTDKSLKHLRITVLAHRRDSHYREMGKLVASLARMDWATNENITQHMNELKAIDQEIGSLQKELTMKK